jgi:hypothetical protein
VNATWTLTETTPLTGELEVIPAVPIDALELITGPFFSTA